MFEKYKKYLSEFVEIPLPKGKNKLYINENGQVLSLKNGILPISVDMTGHITVKADLWSGYEEYKVSILILVAYSKLKLEPRYFHLVDPFYLDGDRKNLHPSNIGYRYYEPIECEHIPGFYWIPFFNNYVINRLGELRHWKFNLPIRSFIFKQKDNPRNVKGGYNFYSINSDAGKFTIGRYRLLCLTFKEYPDDVDSLIVNHTDGNPTNDDLENLEWATRLENIEHAFASGLRTQNKLCYGKNIFTGEEKGFYSYSAASRYTKVAVSTFSDKLARNEQDIYSGGWIFKSNKLEPWKEFSNPEEKIKAMSSPTEVLSKNIFTGIIRKHFSINQIGEDLNLANKQAPKTQILRNSQHPYCGYLFKTIYDKTPWPEFSDRELAIFKENPTGHARGVLAVDKDGKELFFTNIKKASEYFKQILKSKNDVIKAIARKRNVDGYRLTYI